MHRQRRLEWRDGGQRISVHGRANSKYDLYADLHGRWWQRLAIGNRFGQHPSADRDNQCEPEHGHERRFIDSELDLDKCDLLYRLRRV